MSRKSNIARCSCVAALLVLLSLALSLPSLLQQELGTRGLQESQEVSAHSCSSAAWMSPWGTPCCQGWTAPGTETPGAGVQGLPQLLGRGCGASELSLLYLRDTRCPFQRCDWAWKNAETLHFLIKFWNLTANQLCSALLKGTWVSVVYKLVAAAFAAVQDCCKNKLSRVRYSYCRSAWFVHKDVGWHLTADTGEMPGRTLLGFSCYVLKVGR